MDALVLFVSGIAVPIVGYLLKRWWEGQRARDGIQEAVNLASLQKEIVSGTVS